jgi:hypothetical protein
MNRYERQAEQTRRASLQSSLLMWSAGGLLVVAALALLGYSSGAPRNFWSRSAVVVAILLLVVRQLGRRLKSNRKNVVKPDEQSMLHLD